MARFAILSIAAASTLVLAGCSTTTDNGPDDGTLAIVASTNVYGSIAEAIGGDLVSVTSLIATAAQDPHSYEASAQDQLALSTADLVIENGGGYDPFIDTLLEASSSGAVVLTASEASGLLEGDAHDPNEGFNEHVWYSLPGIGQVAEKLSEELSQLDPANATVFEANYATFSGQIDQLETTAAAINAAGSNVAITEPVPLYLLEAVGFTNVTPEAFSEAIEEGTDVAPATLQQTLALFDSGSVSLLAYNSQTASAETERVREAAENNDVPVVEFTETLPDGADYVAWMTDNLAAIAAAIGR